MGKQRVRRWMTSRKATRAQRCPEPPPEKIAEPAVGGWVLMWSQMIEYLEESMPNTLDMIQEISKLRASWVKQKTDLKTNQITHTCHRCGKEESIVIPVPMANIKSPGDVPAEFDLKFYEFTKQFLSTHKQCPEPNKWPDK